MNMGLQSTAVRALAVLSAWALFAWFGALICVAGAAIWTVTLLSSLIWPAGEADAAYRVSGQLGAAP